MFHFLKPTTLIKARSSHYDIHNTASSVYQTIFSKSYQLHSTQHHSSAYFLPPPPFFPPNPPHNRDLWHNEAKPPAPLNLIVNWTLTLLDMLMQNTQKMFNCPYRQSIQGHVGSICKIEIVPILCLYVSHLMEATITFSSSITIILDESDVEKRQCCKEYCSFFVECTQMQCTAW